jgi:hypothetical protein
MWQLFGAGPQFNDESWLSIRSLAMAAISADTHDLLTDTAYDFDVRR